MRRSILLGILLCCCLPSCDQSDPQGLDAVAEVAEVAPDNTAQDELDQNEALETDMASRELPPFTAVTFNTGTSGFAPDEGNYGYNQEQAGYNDDLYGNGIAWKPFVEMTATWFAQVNPDVVVFQEIFWPGECPDIPAEAQVGFVCEDYTPDMPTVAQMLLGEGYQVMCHPGKPDKCAAVKRQFGKFMGCDDDLCLEGLTGFTVDGCGKGARVARGVIELETGGTITLVNVHGSSGFTDEDAQCRRRQFEQVFVDLGDGEPGANGEINLIMGDFNTDPGRLADSDVSAARVIDFVGTDKPFHFITEVGMDAPGTYGGLLNIDHVISDQLTGSCWHAGVTQDHPPVMDAMFFDHVPAGCRVGGSRQ